MTFKHNVVVVAARSRKSIIEKNVFYIEIMTRTERRPATNVHNSRLDEFDKLAAALASADNFVARSNF